VTRLPDDPYLSGTGERAPRRTVAVTPDALFD
jgi:hypothetical protein